MINNRLINVLSWCLFVCVCGGGGWNIIFSFSFFLFIFWRSCSFNLLMFVFVYHFPSLKGNCPWETYRRTSDLLYDRCWQLNGLLYSGGLTLF